MLFHVDGREVPATEIRAALIEGAEDAGVPIEVAEWLFASVLAGNESDMYAIEELIPGLECVAQIGFGT